MTHVKVVEATGADMLRTGLKSKVLNVWMATRKAAWLAMYYNEYFPIEIREE